MAEIIVALDLPTREDALALVERIPDLIWVKVGSVLYTAEGPNLVSHFASRGLSVFLDLKWHDIPNTVAGAVSAAGSLGVAMATVHTLGGDEMLRAAAAAASTARDEFKIVGVTVLTSHSGPGYAKAVGRDTVDPAREVARLAGEARDAGLAGIVASPLEAGVVRSVIGPEGLIVTPGIRRKDDAVGDQVRVMGPAEAVATGATHLVVGRPITGAADPAAAYREFVEECS